MIFSVLAHQRIIVIVIVLQVTSKYTTNLLVIMLRLILFNMTPKKTRSKYFILYLKSFLLHIYRYHSEIHPYICFPPEVL